MDDWREKVKGLHDYRLRDNPHEKIALELWQDHNIKGNLLQHLLGNGEKKHYTDEREEQVANTLMQWLGSPVGRSWLGQLNERFEELDAKIWRRTKRKSR